MYRDSFFDVNYDPVSPASLLACHTLHIPTSCNTHSFSALMSVAVDREVQNK